MCVSKFEGGVWKIWGNSYISHVARLISVRIFAIIFSSLKEVLMETIGIICEYNPFHNGHVYHINKIKEMYPDSIIILCVNGYFGERGDVSILSKEDKTKLALNNGVNIVVELPFVFASNSADTFAEASVKILNYMKVDKIIFGSESNDINKLTLIAKKQLEEDFSLKIKEEIKKGINYPTALNKGIGINLNSPNDLLGVSALQVMDESMDFVSYQSINIKLYLLLFVGGAFFITAAVIFIKEFFATKVYSISQCEQDKMFVLGMIPYDEKGM